MSKTTKPVADIEDLLGQIRTKAKQQGESQLAFFVNGKRYEFDAIDPEKTVIEFLREQHLTGTKLGCAEGGCGACTIVVSSFDTYTKKLVHRPINSCLTTVGALHGCAVTTVEGLAESKGALQKTLHPIQHAMADQHATQCGFCTPGIIMSMYAMWLTHGNTLTPHAVEEGLDGNLCRCTGYRPITNALTALADALGEDKESADHHHHDHDHDHDHDDPNHECLGRDETTKICNRTGKPCAGTCHGSSALKAMVPSLSVEWAGKLQDQQQGTFEKLPTAGPGPLYLCGGHLGEEVEWFAPRSLEELCCVLRANQLLGKSVRLAMGNSERRVEKLFKRNHVYPLALVTPANVLDLKAYSYDAAANTVTLGCAAPMHDLEHFLKGLADQFESSSDPKDRFKAMVPRAYANQMKWFAGRQVRNAASIGGNLCTASPISDLNALHMASGATVTVARFDETLGALATREISIASGFFTGYRQTCLEPHDVVVSITIPLCRPHEFFFAFKQCRRKEDDIAIVNAAFRTKLSADLTMIEGGAGVFGGMAATMKASAKYAAMAATSLNLATISAITAEVRDELKLPENVPGGMGTYRTQLAASFTLKNLYQIVEFIVNSDVAESLGASTDRLAELRQMMATENFEDATRHTTNKFHPLPITGLQHKHHKVPIDYKNNLPDYSQLPFMGGVGASAKHLTADGQVSGESKYIDDIPLLPGEVYAALVTSTHPRAKIVSISTERAEKESHGFIAFYNHKDIPSNAQRSVGAILHDEDVFAVDEVYAVGQVIGIVIAETALGAREAAALVDVRYSTEGVEPPCLTIDDAIRRERFYSMAPGMPNENKMELCKYPGQKSNPKLPAADTENVIVSADAAPAPDYDALMELLKADPNMCVVEGEVYMGGQEHFYLETNVCRVWVGENSEINVEAGTQHTAKTQAVVGDVTGVPYHKVHCTVRRLGGGFGGKETRPSFFAGCCAIAAVNSGRPVRLVVDRDVDMQCTGQRNAFKAFYKVAANRTTQKLEAVVMRSYCSAGWSADLSVPVAERAIFASDGAYVAPFMQFKQYVCRTNISSNTAFRGFGSPQGFFFAETYMDHVAREMGVSPAAFKMNNLIRINDKPPHGWPELEDNLCEIVDRVRETSSFCGRLQQVEQFNNASRYLKRGLTLTPVKYGIGFGKLFMGQGSALLHLYQDGSLYISHGGIEMGQGLNTKVAQVVATAFNVPLSAVHVGPCATDKVPNSQPTAASMGSDLLGGAAAVACDIMLQRVRPYIEKATETFVAEKGYKSMEADAKPQDYVTVLAAAAWNAHWDRVELTATGIYRSPVVGWDWLTKSGQIYLYAAYGCAVAEVEVDTLTGDHTTLRVDLLHDTGAPLNPAIDMGQVEGGFVQGMGLYTIEELVRMPNTGAMFTKGPGTYKIPGFGDMPKDFRAELLNKPTAADTIHKSKGVGEPPLLLGYSVAAAIKEAVVANRVAFAERVGNQSHVSEKMKALIAAYARKYFRVDSPFTAEKIRTAMWDEVSAPMAAIAAGDEEAVRAWLESTLSIVNKWNLQV